MVFLLIHLFHGKILLVCRIARAGSPCYFCQLLSW